MGGGEVDESQNAEEVEGAFFVVVQEEEECAGEEVEGLAVPDCGVVDCKGAEDIAEGADAGGVGAKEVRGWVRWGANVCGGCGPADVGSDGVGFEVDVVWVGAVEVAFDVFAVVFAELVG